MNHNQCIAPLVTAPALSARDISVAQAAALDELHPGGNFGVETRKLKVKKDFNRRKDALSLACPPRPSTSPLLLRGSGELFNRRVANGGGVNSLKYV